MSKKVTTFTHRSYKWLHNDNNESEHQKLIVFVTEILSNDARVNKFISNKLYKETDDDLTWDWSQFLQQLS